MTPHALTRIREEVRLLHFPIRDDIVTGPGATPCTGSTIPDPDETPRVLAIHHTELRQMYLGSVRDLFSDLCNVCFGTKTPGPLSCTCLGSADLCRNAFRPMKPTDER